MRRKKFGLILISVIFLIASTKRIVLLVSAERKLNYYEAKIKKLEKENEILKKKINQIKNDPYFTEKILRENYGYIKEGEIVFRIKEK